MITYTRQKSIKMIAEKSHLAIMGSNVDNENLHTYCQSVGIEVFNAKLTNLPVQAYTLYDLNRHQAKIVISNLLEYRDWILRLAEELGKLLVGWQYQIGQNNQKITAQIAQSSERLGQMAILDYPFLDVPETKEKLNPVEVQFFASHFLIPDLTGRPTLNRLKQSQPSFGQLIQQFTTIYFVNEQIARHRLNDLS